MSLYTRCLVALMVWFGLCSVILLVVAGVSVGRFQPALSAAALAGLGAMIAGIGASTARRWDS